jgi:AraC family transcriptional regulator, regulatory protein of adaptative response / methylated-DNA-[protein]-cysteine methyltransferase
LDGKNRDAPACQGCYLDGMMQVIDDDAAKAVQAATTRDPRWARVLGRDASADGLFWYSVLTTGVYCRPSCPSRAARPDNVRLHNSLAEAKATGFRACKRCDPDRAGTGSANAALVARACRMIAEAEEEPDLGELARALGRSPGRLHRMFRDVTGTTPKRYAKALQGQRIRRELLAGHSVTGALQEAGVVSASRFYEGSKDMLGMAPRAFRSGGRDEQIRFAVGISSLGHVLVASSERGVCCVTLGDDPQGLIDALEDMFPRAELVGADADYESLVARVVGFIETPSTGLDLPLDIRGSLFQQQVWQALRAIPAGQTVSYTEIARRIGAPSSTRAVAGACAGNRIAVAIPCHRVVRQDGSLSGYRWGVERKKALLERERGG